jgi:hypothetical protein
MTTPPKLAGLSGPLVLLGLAAAALLTASAAFADVLVTRDGARIETSGPWEVRGRLVVFSRADGSLASLRLDEVDVERSRQATEQTAHPPATEASGEDAAEGAAGSGSQEVRIQLTDADFTTVSRPPEDGGEGAEEGSGERGRKALNALSVTSWEESESAEAEGVQLTGSFKNDGSAIAAGIALTVGLYDEAGDLLRESRARLSQPSLAPGEVGNFRVVFSGLYAFSEARFAFESSPVRIQAPPRPASPTGTDLDAEPDAGEEPAAETAREVAARLAAGTAAEPETEPPPAP